jgi:hypothetical protein
MVPVVNKIAANKPVSQRSLRCASFSRLMGSVGHKTKESILVSKHIALAVALSGAMAMSACTFNIQPTVPSVPPRQAGSGPLACKAILLLPQEFVSREYVSSFEAREIRIAVGTPTAEAVHALVASRFASVQKVPVPGDGTLDFVRLSTAAHGDTELVLRPRFLRLDSSVRPFRYNIEIGVSVDVAGLKAPVTPSGQGTGSAGLYVQSEIQKAADEALAETITSLAANFPTSCQ